SVDIIRSAKQELLPVSCEVTPHHFAFCDSDISEDSGRFKMNPPLRSQQDRQAILEGIADGTIDVIATDHAPHTHEEKSKGLAASAFGTVGLETAFAAANSFLVEKGIISLERLLYMMCDKPRSILKTQTVKSFVMLDTQKEYTVEPKDFMSMGRSTPFDGVRLKGQVVMTVVDGQIVYLNGGQVVG
ncbi:MAG: amidohydrolase family protein, partial [Oscillospiraceae bacterium]|nr:amidohydrolase family protein [Oscillospiraceae bacterium]